jgi:hypothetical protein
MGWRGGGGQSMVIMLTIAAAAGDLKSISLVRGYEYYRVVRPHRSTVRAHCEFVRRSRFYHSRCDGSMLVYFLLLFLWFAVSFLSCAPLFFPFQTTKTPTVGGRMLSNCYSAPFWLGALLLFLMASTGEEVAVDYPYEVDPADHCETSAQAYCDILPVLKYLCDKLGKTKVTRSIACQPHMFAHVASLKRPLFADPI